MSAPTRRPGSAGFTLIELVVALGLAGIVSLILLQGMRLAVTGLQRVSQQADRLDRRQGLETVLRHELSGCVAAPVGDRAAWFAGRPTRLQFLTVADDGGPGLYRIDLALEGRRLVLTRQLAGPAAEPRFQRSTLADDIRSFGIAYFGATKPGEDPGWHDRWERLSYLPKLVRVTLDADGASRPPLVIRLWSGG